jgi:hypothetical protein
MCIEAKGNDMNTVERMNLEQFNDYLLNSNDNFEVRINSLGDHDLKYYYNLVTSQDADGRWSRKRLVDNVMNSLYYHRDNIVKIKNKEIEEKKKREEIQERIDRRGSIEVFLSQNFDAPEVFEGDKKLRNLLFNIRNQKENYSGKILPEFKNKLNAGNVVYTLSWSSDFARESVKYEMGLEVIQMFERGATFEQIISHYTKEVIRRSSYISNRSTSVMSNMIEDVTVSVMADFINNSVYW